MLTAFLFASVVLAITPGPGVLYIVNRSLILGRRCGLISVAGVALGNLGNAIAASSSLAVLLARSALAFSVIKYAGAAYLVYLGIQALRRPATTAPIDCVPVTRAGAILREGAMVALFNPKTALFFAAFLPQFIETPSPSILHIASLGSLFVAIAATTDAMYAVIASAVAPVLRRSGGVHAAGRFASGAMFIGLGVFAACGDSPSAV